jgi:hypothetical protein
MLGPQRLQRYQLAYRFPRILRGPPYVMYSSAQHGYSRPRVHVSSDGHKVTALSISLTNRYLS